MIKLRKSGRGYILDCPENWFTAVTERELKALYLLLKKHYKCTKQNDKRTI